MGAGPESRRRDAIRAVETFLLQKVRRDRLTGFNRQCAASAPPPPREPQMLHHPKDEVSIVLVGTAETANAVAESLPGSGYENIVELTRGFAPASMSVLKKLGDLPETSAEADIVCGVVCAIQLFATSGVLAMRLFHASQ